MKTFKEDFMLIMGIICGIIIIIIGLVCFLGEGNNAIANSAMILVAGILQVVIGYNFSIKNKKIQSLIFYFISIFIFVLFILSIVK